MSGTSVDLNIVDSPAVITFSHYGANYIVEEDRTIVGAWGSGSIGSTNGPLAQNQTQYLYWDIDLATGALTRGWTGLPWIYTTAEPLNPPNDLHWFDLNTNRMRVFRQPNPNSNGYWQDKIRVFAGIYHSNAILQIYPIGSQVGITGGEYLAGNLLLGANNVPLKQSDGTFATTATQLIVQQTSGQNVQFDAALIFGEASEEIPAFYLVTFQPGKRIGLARSSDYYHFVCGIVTQELYQEEVGQVITNGIVRNDQWAFTQDQIGMPLFCGPTGQVTLTPPPVGVSQQIGTVYDVDSINLNIWPPVRIR